MRFVKGIGLFLLYPLAMLAAGFFIGMETYRFFYPGIVWQTERQTPREETLLFSEEEQGIGKTAKEKLPGAEPAVKGMEEALPAAASSETLYVGTEYVLEETDITNQTVVETTWDLPDKYVGMDREQFLTAMEVYQASPPLSELERGFVGLEVLSFSRERVVVQMNYRYVQPSSHFYLAAYDNKVIVYLEDQKTVFIETDIPLDTLPEDVRLQVIQMMPVEGEESLYNFLETYSS